MPEPIFKRELPELEKQFGAFAKKALEEGALLAKNKELIVAALSIAVKCEPCLEHHLRQALRKGATTREIAEALGVALLMVGDSASAWPLKTVNKVLYLSFILTIRSIRQHSKESIQSRNAQYPLQSHISFDKITAY